MATTNKKYTSALERSFPLSISVNNNNEKEAFSNYDQHSEEVFELISQIQETGLATAIIYKTEEGVQPKTTIRFRLSNPYHQYYPLMKGYLLMGKNEFLKSDDRNQSFIIEMKSENEEEVSSFVNIILKWFEAEMIFKSNLKTVLRHEKQFNIAVQNIYERLHSNSR